MLLRWQTGNRASRLRGGEKLAPAQYSQLMIFPSYKEVTLLGKSHLLLIPRDSSLPSRNWKLNVLVKIHSAVLWDCSGNKITVKPAPRGETHIVVLLEKLHVTVHNVTQTTCH